MVLPHLSNEIYDMIFSLLPFNDIMRCHRVCRAWSAVLRDGHKVSKKLFRYRETMRLDPDATSKREFLTALWKKQTTTPGFGGRFKDYIMHPLLYRLNAYTLRRQYVYEPDLWRLWSFKFRIETLLAVLATADGRSNPEASWRNTFVSYPPFRKGRLEVRAPSHGATMRGLVPPRETVRRYYNLDNEYGVTLNDYFFQISNLASERFNSFDEWKKIAPQKWIEKMPFYVKARLYPTWD